MNNIFKNYYEYVTFRTNILIGRDNYGIKNFQQIDKIISANLINHPLEHNEQSGTCSNLYNTIYSSAYYDMRYANHSDYYRNHTKYEVLSMSFPRISIINVLLTQCFDPKFAFNIIQYIINKGVHCTCDSTVVSTIIKNYANYVKYHVNNERKHNFMSVDTLFSPTICTIVKFVINNIQINGNIVDISVDIIVDICDIISCADIDLLKYMINNNYIECYENIDIMKHLINCANNNSIFVNNSIVCNNGGKVKYKSKNGDITMHYIDMAKYLFKQRIVTFPISMNYCIEIKNELFFSFIRARIIEYNIVNGVYFCCNIPAPIGNLISCYDWS